MRSHNALSFVAGVNICVVDTKKYFTWMAVTVLTIRLTH
jgi:hypothetical protein